MGRGMATEAKRRAVLVGTDTARLLMLAGELEAQGLEVALYRALYRGLEEVSNERCDVLVAIGRLAPADGSLTQLRVTVPVVLLDAPDVAELPLCPVGARATLDTTVGPEAVAERVMGLLAPPPSAEAVGGEVAPVAAPGASGPAVEPAPAAPAAPAGSGATATAAPAPVARPHAPAGESASRPTESAAPLASPQVAEPARPTPTAPAPASSVRESHDALASPATAPGRHETRSEAAAVPAASAPAPAAETTPAAPDRDGEPGSRSATPAVAAGTREMRNEPAVAAIPVRPREGRGETAPVPTAVTLDPGELTPSAPHPQLMRLLLLVVAGLALGFGLGWWFLNWSGAR